MSAVTVGSWFSKNISIDIPLLKILGGASVTDLVDEAVSRLSPEAIPHSDASEEAVQAVTEAQLTAVASSSGSLDESTSSVDYDIIATPPSLHSLDDEGFEREVPLSVTQEYAWKQQQLPLAPETFNSTIGMHMQGPLNPNRLSWAFNQALQRNDAFRTCFIPDQKGSSQPIQAIMESPRVYFEAV